METVLPSFSSTLNHLNMSGHQFLPQSSLCSPIHAVKPSLSFKVVNYIVHCLLPKTIKPTLWTSRDFSQSVSNIGLYNLWQGGIFTNFSLAYIPVSQSHSFFGFYHISHMANAQLAAQRSEEVSLKKLDISVFSLTLSPLSRARMYPKILLFM